MPCFYAPHLQPGMKNLIVEGEEYHHIVHVFRKKESESLMVTNGIGLMITALIDSIGKKNLALKTISSHQQEKSIPFIAAGFSLLRSKNDHIIVEKLTELGVSEFFPFVCERSVRTASGNTHEKFFKTAVAAIKQCDNPFLPQINKTENLETALSSMQSRGYSVLAALERDADKLVSDCLPEPLPGRIALLFGPEGGFSDEEILLLNNMAVQGFTIGNHILRAETAAIAGVAQLMHSILKKQPAYF